MFGFVKPYVPNLKVKEDKFYKSVYCGLCRSMSRHTTEMSCASLSFDMTFFALVRIWATNEKCHIVLRRCYAHPFKKRPMVADCKSLEFTSYVNSYLSYYKLIDNVNDNKGIKKMLWKIAARFFKSTIKKVPIEYSSLGDYIKTKLDEMSALEKEKCDMPSLMADKFGELLGYAMSFGLDEYKSIVYEIGKKVGRWVYLADALCDYKDDIKNGSYNPFLLSLGEEKIEDFINSSADGVLSSELIDAYNAFNLGPNVKTECYGCIENIILEGMRETFNKSIEKIGAKDVKKSV